MDVFKIIVLFALISMIIVVFVRYLISINKDYTDETDNRIKQKKVQENMLFYRCKNEGESLDDCDIYYVSYDAIGYKDVE